MSDDRTVILAISRGQVPPGIDPESLQGQEYARMAAAIRQNLASAPPMTDEQKRLISALLRGGGNARESV
jgi:hypothetical protein